MAKKEDSKTIERTYNVPLRKEFLKSPHWKRTQKAVYALRQFLTHHLKSDNIKISDALNKEMWKHGIRNPPHHIKVNVTKNDKGEVFAELFGYQKKEKKSGKKAKVDKKVPLQEAKPEAVSPKTHPAPKPAKN
jgi:large subunit ribosomal protein L31e